MAQVNPKPSMFSLVSNANTTAHRQSPLNPHSALTNSSRPCNNCTCSPGLLSRQGRRSSILKRMSISRSSSSRSIHSRSSSTPGTSPRRSSIRAATESLYTIDDTNTTACGEDVLAKEINTSMRLEKLRNEMKLDDLALYLIPSEDSHQSEYTSPVDQRRSFISGFSGSAGIAIITRDVTCMNDTPEGLSALATDGRYFAQASNELDFNWMLLKQGLKTEPTWQEWTISQAFQLSIDSGEEIKIGLDPKLFTFQQIESLEQLIKEEKVRKPKGKVSLMPVKENLIDKIWSHFEERPIRQFNKVIKLDLKYTGESTRSKLVKLKAYFQQYNSSTLILNSLDQIAWLLNLRGDDIEYNPLFYSYLIIQNDQLTLYTDHHERFEEDDLKEYLKDINCDLKNYEDIWFDIRKIAISLHSEGSTILLTPECSWKMVNCIVAENYSIISSPISRLKEIKNDVELKGQEISQIRDSLALIRYFSWLEHSLVSQNELISEYEAGKKLYEFRSVLENFKGLSFETISSTGANSSIIHYAPPKTSSSIINPNKIYLCDSGAQFLEGTTDTTRTLHFTTPTKEEIKNYTLVLKGHLALTKLIFPEGYTGFQIDSLARQFLWSEGLDYNHGTGHGVDAYGPVHSMGVGIGVRQYCNENALVPGHLISNEPGYYEDNKYGIRIENMFYVKECEKFKKSKNETSEEEEVATAGSTERKWLDFKTVTLVPYCKKLIDVKLLTQDEKESINSYHLRIWNQYKEELKNDKLSFNWLKRETSPV